MCQIETCRSHTPLQIRFTCGFATNGVLYYDYGWPKSMPLTSSDVTKFRHADMYATVGSCRISLFDGTTRAIHLSGAIFTIASELAEVLRLAKEVSA